ncbi:MAG: L,D-transpeptidase [Myxococcales bacterium]|nr:L,D-transpeptidase [Myxococcales bacterium]
MLRRLLLAILVLIAVSPLLCSEAAAQRATKHKVTRVLVKKKAHTLQLFAGDEIVATYRASIGDGGPGHKLREGDKVTPVGRYHVTTHQPSHYKIFLRLDYPNAEDRARFAQLKREGKLPPSARIGGDIGIHGVPVDLDPDFQEVLTHHDWTLGCIAVGNAEISQIAARVPNGTVVDIED